MEDWSLQAIVRGSSGDLAKIVDIEMDGQDPFFDSSIGSSDELEEICKPFYTAAHSNLSSAQTVLEFQEQRPQNINVVEDKPTNDQSDQSTGTSSVVRVTAGYTPKIQEKNQHKRVVIQVSAEGLASDMWAWRKYGQKPIKGSPYPRSYYRCSSSKGCLARKQVEQSCSDPGMFIVTYTAEHSHSQPTRRNSLAGTVRQKFPSHKTPNTKTVIQEKTEESSSSGSPKTIQHQDEVNIVTQPKITEENKAETIEARVFKEESHDDSSDFIMPDFVLNEDFFSGLVDFDEFISAPPQQFPAVRSSCSWF
ncbi:hypothetical protein DH2020_028850 [Rehmannia glutinosa]|uniref:WRKY domain-containing protein n=1 Tax=Rehmannia glutinosa TaxID=99300 RepID=A0ABR0VTY9_REHGL